MTPERLRSRVVLLVIAAIIALAFGLYAIVGVLLWQDREATIPGELWLAAGVFGGALVGFLSNSKGGSEGGTAGARSTSSLSKGPSGATEGPEGVPPRQ